MISSAQQRQAQFAFIVFPILYSVGFFGWCSLAEKMPIFSKRNSRSMPSVICGHVSVLLLLAMLAQMTFRFYPSLPNWLTDQTFRLRGSEHSVFEVLGIIFVLTIGAIEKRWIYIDSGTDNSEAMDRPS